MHILKPVEGAVEGAPPPPILPATASLPLFAVACISLRVICNLFSSSAGTMLFIVEFKNKTCHLQLNFFSYANGAGITHPVCSWKHVYLFYIMLFSLIYIFSFNTCSI